MQILIALLVFSVIIIIHELGHFSLARKNGVTRTEMAESQPALWQDLCFLPRSPQEY